MRGFWTEFLYVAANHPFPSVPGDLMSPLDLDRHDECLYLFNYHYTLLLT
ncbi:hypothetical protein KGM_209481 [Danaus plexippus plexippus]|uniref:Uncharacterized protein n=1 Tax=Danaus plexippus plexippus TaxID=278856 RepID=A0A212FLG1_DANPL|nr:hypothetical protein KGM_209481 [Danaus plexippus plexippus]